MEKIKGDEPAFASKASSSNGTTFGSKGLTIRQHFAAMAMSGMLSNATLIDILNKQVPLKEHHTFLAEASVEQADALIAELNKS